MKADVAVIGAGVAGMSAALALTRQGRRVVVVERDRRVGPLLRRFRRGGHWCDGGFHYSGGLHAGGALDVLFRYFGAPEGALEPVALDPEGFDTLITPRGREVRLPVGFGPLGEALAAAFPGSTGAGRQYAAELERLHRATPFFFFDFGPEDVLYRRKGAGVSLDGMLRAAGAEAELIETLGSYGLALYGSPAGEIPFDYHAMVIGSLCYSAHTLRHGGDGIIGALEGCLARQGVEVLCGRPARGICMEGGRVRGVEVDGERIECGACIFTGHPKALPGLLPAETAPGLRARVGAMENSIGLFAVFLEAEAVPAGLRAGNVYRIPGGGDVLAVLGTAPRNVASGGSDLLVALAPSRWAGGGETEYAEYKARETERIVGGAFEIFPELRGRCRVIAAASPRTYERLTGTVEGSAYGLLHTVRRRSLTPLSGVEGLYLAGQSTVVSGVVSAAISGIIAAALIVGIGPIWGEIQKCR